MKILVACEESQAVTKELRMLGHEAYSCDIEPCSGGHPEWHIQEDVLPLLNGNCEFKTRDEVIHSVCGKWDMLIAFPPCTHLAVSGAAHFVKKREDGRQEDAIKFFMEFINADCSKIAVENPVNIISGTYIKKWFTDLDEKHRFPVKYTQSIQPYEFGDHAKKKTCLWLKGLSPLKATNVVDAGEFYVSPKGRLFSKGSASDMAIDENGKILSWKDPRTAKIRSKTFPGIAKAMAEQWAGSAAREE